MIPEEVAFQEYYIFLYIFIKQTDLYGHLQTTAQSKPWCKINLRSETVLERFYCSNVPTQFRSDLSWKIESHPSVPSVSGHTLILTSAWAAGGRWLDDPPRP
jgi:hypothetical protein